MNRTQIFRRRSSARAARPNSPKGCVSTRCCHARQSSRYKVHLWPDLNNLRGDDIWLELCDGNTTIPSRVPYTAWSKDALLVSQPHCFALSLYVTALRAKSAV
jgi:hypothetical protein